ncbi:calmodulin-binding protein 60 A-like isoform X2 [Diospyros lotus]|nr:calmodulin-binding protein 60 A-like isoform X2 [Diospyros lotus]
MEPWIRRVVKEEVESALRKYLTGMEQNCTTEIHSVEPRALQLQFLTGISLPVFTGARIEGADCNPLKVALIDDVTREVVYTGPESSAKVEIVVLEGDFDADDGGNWTLEEFKNNIVREREGKKPLLTGDTQLNLKEGTGLVREIYFTDNSSWTRSRKFRMGARVVDNFDGIRIKEAKTQSFIVKDHRGELYKKHHPPSLRDEVWRLEKIGKDGAFHKRLSEEKVSTVKDFLRLLFMDPTRLRNILGMGMSSKMWETTVNHARTCMLDPSLYFYCPPGSESKTGVAFNIVGQVKGLVYECKYADIARLSESEKAEACKLVTAAFKQWEDVISFDDEAALSDGMSSFFNDGPCSNSATVETSLDSKSLTSQSIDIFNYPQSSACSPDIIPSVYPKGNSLDDLSEYSIDNTDPLQSLTFADEAAPSLICETESFTQTFLGNEQLQYFRADTSLESRADTSVVDGFLLSRPHRRWTILFSVLRWFSVRRILRTRKRTMSGKHKERERDPVDG